MGRGLADGIAQGGAGLDEFRTAPLWGVGQRVFFLHDGRIQVRIRRLLNRSSSSCSWLNWRYKQYDIAGQQLINAGFVLINGERLDFDLQRAESDIR
jgi:hypothetical protein